MSFDTLTARERFLIGEALALAVVTDSMLPSHCQRLRDSEDGAEMLRANFPPDQVAFHSFHAGLRADGPTIAYYEGDMQGSPEHRIFWDALARVFEALEAEAA